MTGLAAPRVECAWTATALGANFGGYNVYARPSRGAVFPWVQVGAITVPAGYTPATVEAQHNQFWDHMAGWTIPGGQWSDGWDYAYTSLNAVTGVESPKTAVVSMVKVSPDLLWWVTSNQQPWLNFSLAVLNLAGADTGGLSVSMPVGRDGRLGRTHAELPMRDYDIDFQDFTRLGEDPIRPWRAAASIGGLMALLGPRGDRAIGALDNPTGLTHNPDGRFSAKGRFSETQRSHPAADYNLPAGVVLNGTTQYATTADNALLNPTTVPFTVFVAGVFPNAGLGLVGKGDIAGATTSNYGITRPSSNTIRFAFKGVTTAGTVDEANATWVDGNPHVAVGTSTGTAQVLYRDGVQVNTGAVTHGSITTTKALVAGADNAGASGFMGLNPLRAWGFYPRALTATEAQNLSYYLLGYPGYRLPAGASVFYDLRDARTWNGVVQTLADQAGNSLPGTLIAAPATRGIVAPLVLLDRYG